MEFIISTFNTVFVHPIFNLLVMFYKLFLSIGLPGAFGFAILSLTILIRLFLHPFFKQSMELSKKMQDLKPQLDSVSKKHKNDPKKLQQEQMKLYQEAGVNPASGCLFAIVQLPIFLALFQTLNEVAQNASKAEEIDKINALLYSEVLKIQSIDTWFFGIDLAINPADGANSGLWYYYLIPLVTGGLQYLQTLHSPLATQTKQNKKTLESERSKDGKDKDEDKKDQPSTAEDFQKALNMQMKYFFPVMIAWVSYTLPSGLALYWNSFSIFSIIQHKQMHREDKEKEEAKKKEKSREKEDVLEGEIIEKEEEKESALSKTQQKKKAKRSKKK